MELGLNYSLRSILAQVRKAKDLNRGPACIQVLKLTTHAKFQDHSLS